MIPGTTLVWSDKMITFSQNCLISLFSLAVISAATSPALRLLADPEARSAATGVPTPLEREGQPSGSRICLMVDSPQRLGFGLC